MRCPGRLPFAFDHHLVSAEGIGLQHFVPYRMTVTGEPVEAGAYYDIAATLGSQAEPLCVGILRKSGNVELHDLPEYVDVLGVDGERALPSTTLLPHPASIEVLSCPKLMATSVDGLAVDANDATYKDYAMYAMPVGYQGDELSLLSLVCVLEELYFLTITKATNIKIPGNYRLPGISVNMR